MFRTGGQFSGEECPLGSPGEYWETRRFRASNKLIAITTTPSRTCPQSPGGHSDDEEKKTADGRGADPQPRAYDSSLPPPPPTLPAPRPRGRASFFRRIRNVARRAMPYRREGLGAALMKWFLIGAKNLLKGTIPTDKQTQKVIERHQEELKVIGNKHANEKARIQAILKRGGAGFLEGVNIRNKLKYELPREGYAKPKTRRAPRPGRAPDYVFTSAPVKTSPAPSDFV